MLSIQTQSVLGAPGWVLRDSAGKAATIDFDFEHGRLYQRGLGSHSNYGGLMGSRFITTSRSSTGYIDNLAGLYTSVAANVARISDKGLLVEETRTNLALWCRDLTNAVWVPTTMTAALTATGVDGAANSATTITATGALAKIIQTVTHTSSADTVSFFIKRRTGTGIIEITGDGVAFTDITSSLSTTAWYRASISATLVNPVFGIRITTSGDAVDVDFAQLEVGTWATSPIFTTAVSTTRAADAASASIPPTFGVPITLFASAVPLAPTAFTSNQMFLAISDGTVTNFANLARGANTGVASSNAVGTIAAGYTQYNGGPSGNVLPTGVLAKGATAVTNNGVISKINIGCRPNNSLFANSYIRRAAMWSTQNVSADKLIELTR